MTLTSYIYHCARTNSVDDRTSSVGPWAAAGSHAQCALVQRLVRPMTITAANKRSATSSGGTQKIYAHRGKATRLAGVAEVELAVWHPELERVDVAAEAESHDSESLRKVNVADRGGSVTSGGRDEAQSHV